MRWTSAVKRLYTRFSCKILFRGKCDEQALSNNYIQGSVVKILFREKCDKHALSNNYIQRFCCQILFSGKCDEHALSNNYLIGKNFVGKKLRNFRQVTKIFTDENFYLRIFFADENFKIVLFCNNFSCRSKVLGSLRRKSDLLRIYSVWDPTYARK